MESDSTTAVLRAARCSPDLLYTPPLPRHDPGEVMVVRVHRPDGTGAVDAELELESYLGSGFAGQVYRSRLLRATPVRDGGIPGFVPGTLYAVKILRPAGAFSRWFRDLVYGLAFQAPFAAEVHPEACRRGLLWQKLVRMAAGRRFGRAETVKDVYGWFVDESLGACGEVTEWIEGRAWRLEADDRLWLRWNWRSVSLDETPSAEYVAKHRFMDRLVRLLEDMGGAEFARQYTWWTMKSQPNVLKRFDLGDGPEDGLCAIDFRAGLALLPFLPMSPADIALIIEGILRRGALVQFDRCDTERLRRFARREFGDSPEFLRLVDEFCRLEDAVRRLQPDVTRQGLALLRDRTLRRDVRHGLTSAWAMLGLTTRDFARRLEASRLLFALFFCLGCLPVLGGFLRRLMGRPDYRAHFRRMASSLTYFRIASRARVAAILESWVRSGRIAPEHAPALLEHPLRFWLECFILGWMPVPVVHRWIREPRTFAAFLRERWTFIYRFWRDADFRRAYLLREIEDAAREGMLTADEKARILARIDDPYISRYLMSLAVHFATLPVTQIVSLLTASIVAGTILVSHGWTPEAWASAGKWFAGILVAFQITPISPGSLCRGLYVVYLVIRERNLRDYLIALPVSFLKYFGYFAFPLQMAAAYPALSNLIAARRVTGAARWIPVFGERGALLEHFVFDATFNVPRTLIRVCRPHIDLLLTIWMGIGLAVWAKVWLAYQPSLLSPFGLNFTLIILVIFVFPRVVFRPLLKRRALRDSDNAGTGD